MKIITIITRFVMSAMAVALAALPASSQVRTIDLGVLDGQEFAQPFAINNKGEVVGDSNFPGQRAFLSTANTGMIDLGTLGGTISSARAINNSGKIVGFSTTSSGHPHAFLWTADTGMTDL